MKKKASELAREMLLNRPHSQEGEQTSILAVR